MSNNKKQVIFIMTDTQRHDMLGCYGNKDMQTPYLDQMAAEGIRYDKAYTCQPSASPPGRLSLQGFSPTPAVAGPTPPPWVTM
jgi:arylsulfatase A-like enzyme